VIRREKAYFNRKGGKESPAIAVQRGVEGGGEVRRESRGERILPLSKKPKPQARTKTLSGGTLKGGEKTFLERVVFGLMPLEEETIVDDLENRRTNNSFYGPSDEIAGH